MTYEMALTELKARYATGERTIEVPMDVYYGYASGLQANVRVYDGKPPSKGRPSLAFKAARVYGVAS